MSSLPFARLQVAVLSRRGRWLMCFRGKRAHFADRRSAVGEAIDQASQCSKNGTPTDVVFVDENLKREVIWTYGVDRVPGGPGSGKHSSVAPRGKPGKSRARPPMAEQSHRSD